MEQDLPKKPKAGKLAKLAAVQALGLARAPQQMQSGMQWLTYKSNLARYDPQKSNLVCCSAPQAAIWCAVPSPNQPFAMAWPPQIRFAVTSLKYVFLI